MGNPVVHWELMSKDPAKVSSFYGNIFGWKIQNRELKLVRVFVYQPESGEIVPEITADGRRGRPKQFHDVQFADHVVVDFKQNPKPVMLFLQLVLVALCPFPC